jgi:hypothetical protein
VTRLTSTARALITLAGALALASPAPAKSPPAAARDLEKAKIVFITGKVNAIDKNFFGRTQRVAIVSLSDNGALMQNPIEDVSAGEELKHHVGEDVTARGVVLVKADGSMSLLIDAFQIQGGKGGFVSDTAQRSD